MKLLACCSVLAALVLAGCGSDDVEDRVNSAADKASSIASDAQSQAESVADEASSVASDAKSVATDAAGAAGAPVKVSQKDIKYIPAVIAVKVGQKVTWSNDDPVAHTSTADNGEFNSGTMQPGDEYSYTPKEAGDIPYFCEIHPNQKGTIKVSS